MWMRSEPARTALQHLEVVVAVEARVDPALQADLGGALRLGLDDASGDLVDLEQVGAAAQVERQRALREGAEPALESADVRVVDVPVGDEGDGVADGLAAELVGDLGDGDHLGAAGGEKGDDLVLADLLAPSTPASTSATAPAAAPISALPDVPARDRGRRHAGRVPGQVDRARAGRRHVAARAPDRVAGEALGVGTVQDGKAQLLGHEPPVGPLRVDGEARAPAHARAARSPRGGARAPARRARG